MKTKLEKQINSLLKTKKNIPMQFITFNGIFSANEMKEINKFLDHFKSESFIIEKRANSIVAIRPDKITFIIKFNALPF